MGRSNIQRVEDLESIFANRAAVSYLIEPQLPGNAKSNRLPYRRGTRRDREKSLVSTLRYPEAQITQAALFRAESV
jgi:hypothetical protein